MGEIMKRLIGVLIVFCVLLWVFPTYATDALLKAADQGDLRTVVNELEKGCDVNYADRNGYTAIINASFYGYINVVKLLVDKGADVNKKTPNGETAILMAAKKNHKEVYDFLKSHGADENVKSSTGSTAKAIIKKYGVVTEVAPKKSSFDKNPDSKTFRERYDRVSVGMLKGEVISILGYPSSTSESVDEVVGKTEMLIFSNGTIFSKLSSITVFFHNGRVSSKNWNEL